MSEIFTRGIFLKENEVRSLKEVINYLYKDEKRHYEETVLDGHEEASKHIFTHIQRLAHAINKKETPHTKKESRIQIGP